MAHRPENSLQTAVRWGGNAAGGAVILYLVSIPIGLIVGTIAFLCWKHRHRHSSARKKKKNAFMFDVYTSPEMGLGYILGLIAVAVNAAVWYGLWAFLTGKMNN